MTAFMLDYKYKLFQHSLDSPSRAQAFLPILEVWLFLLLLPVSMETGPGSWAQQHTLGSDGNTQTKYLHCIHKNAHKRQNNDTTNFYILYDGAFLYCQVVDACSPQQQKKSWQRTPEAGHDVARHTSEEDPHAPSKASSSSSFLKTV